MATPGEFDPRMVPTANAGPPIEVLDHVHPNGWALIITPMDDGRIHSYGPGLSDRQAYEFLVDMVRQYKRILGETRPLVIE